MTGVGRLSGAGVVAIAVGLYFLCGAKRLANRPYRGKPSGLIRWWHAGYRPTEEELRSHGKRLLLMGGLAIAADVALAALLWGKY